MRRVGRGAITDNIIKRIKPLSSFIICTTPHNTMRLTMRSQIATSNVKLTFI